MKIKDFAMLLASDKHDRMLFAALRKLTTIRKPSKIVTAILNASQPWTA